MRIGVITIEQVGNYGAELQCYATQKVLQNIGCDAEVIDYCYYKDYRYKDSKMSEPSVPMTFKERIFYVLKYRIVNRFVDKVLLLFNSNIARRNSRFAAFHAENTKMSRKYMSMPEVYEASMDYDIIVTGSDQVWNPGAQSSIEPYFLTFAPDSARKISFAASFGVSEIEPNLRERYKEYLSRYDFISVREQNACDMVKQLVGKDAECVLDPTLLLDKSEWEISTSGTGIHIYVLTKLDLDTFIVEYLKKSKNMESYQVYNIIEEENPFILQYYQLNYSNSFF